MSAAVLEWLHKWFASPPRIWAPIALATTALLWLPKGITDRLSLTDWVSNFRMLIGLCWLVSCAVLLSHAALWVCDRLRRRLSVRAQINEGRRALLALSLQEKELLAYYIAGKIKTRNLRLKSGVVGGLVDADILYRSATVGDVRGFDYNIQPWAWKELNRFPELLEPELSRVKKNLRRGGRSYRG